MVLRLVEAFADRSLLEGLAQSLLSQPNLTPERSWEALGLLQGTGLIEAYPELVERLEELDELIDAEESSLDELAAQLEGEPEGTWLALQGLGSVEPDVRAEIIAGLANQPLRPGLVEFFRLLIFAHDPATRRAAIEAMESLDADDPAVRDAWSRIAREHPDAEVVEHARKSGAGRRDIEQSALPVAATRLVGSLVTSLDGKGRGIIVLASEDRGEWPVAAFLCDVLQGVRDVVGLVGSSADQARVSFTELIRRPDRDTVEGVSELALGLLAGSLTLCGQGASPALRYWLERTVGPAFHPRTFRGLLPDFDPSTVELADPMAQSLAVIDSCQGWIDNSDLTYDLAEELLLRDDRLPPDPRRDSGAYRFLFENRLQDRLELDRRILFWMASFWQATGDEELARSALVLAWQLNDPQHAVPGHSFVSALATRSLETAQTNLKRGIDLRVPETRSRMEHESWL